MQTNLHLEIESAKSARVARLAGSLPLAAVLCIAPGLYAQAPAQGAENLAARPIAIVATDSKIPNAASEVTGALEVHNGRAFITANGSITAGPETAQVTLPYRGTLLVCASTTVKLATDASIPAGEVPGLMMAMDHGAIEASFATGRNSDVLMTPDFRILIGGPGAAEVKVRLGQGGDTCVDNAGINAPYVLVSSVFEGGAYRVQPGQRVMFQHGSLHEVVDQEKEPCGCPPPLKPQSNEFPLAQSEGLVPTPKPAPSPEPKAGLTGQNNEVLVYKAADHVPQAAVPASFTAAPAPVPAQKEKKKHSGIVRFFRRLFGAED
jgi:hypothetical protein